MTQVSIPHGQSRDGNILVSINGDHAGFPCGQLVNLTAGEIEVLDHAGIRHTSSISGDFTKRCIHDATGSGTYRIDNLQKTIQDIIDFGQNSYTTLNPATDIDTNGIFTAGTLGDHDEFLSIKNPLLNRLLTIGGTFVYTVNFQTGVYALMQVAIRNNSGSDLSYAGGGPNSGSFYAQPETLGAGFETSFSYVNPGINKFAITMRPNQWTVSVNGSAPVSAGGLVIGPTATSVVMQFSAENSSRFRRFDIYDPVDDNVLATLSA